MYDLKGHYRAAARPVHLHFLILASRREQRGYAQRSKFQAPTSREATRLQHPILRTWCLNIHPPQCCYGGRVLWSQNVGFWLLQEPSKQESCVINTNQYE